MMPAHSVAKHVLAGPAGRFRWAEGERVPPPESFPRTAETRYGNSVFGGIFALLNGVQEGTRPNPAPLTCVSAGFFGLAARFLAHASSDLSLT